MDIPDLCIHPPADGLCFLPFLFCSALILTVVSSICEKNASLLKKCKNLYLRLFLTEEFRVLWTNLAGSLKMLLRSSTVTLSTYESLSCGYFPVTYVEFECEASPGRNLTLELS